MDDVSQDEPSKAVKRVLIFFLGLIALTILPLIMGRFDNSTELIPRHDSVLQLCFEIAGVCGFIFAGVAIYISKGIVLWRRIAIAFCAALMGIIAILMVADHAASIIEEHIDFPAGTTKTYTALIQISRAYQTHGKGQSWNIQTMPIWSDLDITKDDYDFMLAHRRPGDDSHNPDEISSKGYFCARVVVQQSGHAIRIMHAGSEKLPQGTVMLCPQIPAPTSAP
ncbi:MAG TPA: hypothetical protein VFU55_12090 [Terracidiphilus sp.]|nr:hypothetical protein [Terracidiphilus sp.]